MRISPRRRSVWRELWVSLLEAPNVVPSNKQSHPFFQQTKPSIEAAHLFRKPGKRRPLALGGKHSCKASNWRVALRMSLPV